MDQKINIIIHNQLNRSCLFLIIIILNFYLNFTNCNSTSYAHSDHYDGSNFHNPEPTEPASFLFVAKHILFGRSDEWEYTTLDNKKDDLKNKKDYKISNLPEDKISVHWVGHATTLIQIGGKNILTDPVWSNVVGPLSFFGPTRAQAPGIDFENLPNIDYVLLSHDHFDHTDIPTLIRLKESFNPKFIVPLGMKELLVHNNIDNVQEMDWWDKIKAEKDLTIHITPAQHNSGRGLFDRNKRLWGSYVMEYKKYRVFFAGDTAYSKHFSDIYRNLGKIHFAILPIGAYEPKEEMRKFHTSPEDAVQAYKDLHADYMFPIHFATFNLTAENQTKPILDLKRSIKIHNINESRFLIRKIGDGWEGNKDFL